MLFINERLSMRDSIEFTRPLEIYMLYNIVYIKTRWKPTFVLRLTVGMDEKQKSSYHTIHIVFCPEYMFEYQSPRVIKGLRVTTIIA